MKKNFQNTFNLAVGFVLLTAPFRLVATGFTEDFEGGLNQWTGQGGGAHHGILVDDPLASGRGSVLTFSQVDVGGDLFTDQKISLHGPVLLSFDYLGLARPSSNPGDLGGFLGISYSLNPVADGQDIFWHAGTDENYPGLLAPLIDDGQWGRYEIIFDANQYGGFRLTLEDWAGSGNCAGDSYFDNISVVAATNPVPEPTVAALIGIASLALINSRRRSV